MNIDQYINWLITIWLIIAALIVFRLQRSAHFSIRQINEYCWNRDVPGSLVLLATGLYILFASVGVTVANKLFPGSIAPKQTAMAISGAASVWIVLMAVRYLTNRGLEDIGLYRENPRARLIEAMRIILILYPFIALLATVSGLLAGLINEDFLKQNHPFLEEIRADKGSPVYLLAVLAMGVNVVLVTPFAEELLFRGLLQGSIVSKGARPMTAICITAAVFAAVHGMTIWTHWPALFAFAFILGTLYERNRSLLLCFFMHSLFNLISFAGSLISGV
ncbi:MAG: lysostaphin resistance A-like protein [Phycisphaerae bacterium]|jgi:membrane protease YdiL (CAAX protease family)